jgi:hypothetical protein
LSVFADELVIFCLRQRIVHPPSSAARNKEATMDNRRRDALSGFSGWWRSWPLLAPSGRGGAESPRTESDLDESGHFAVWAAELAAPGDGLAGMADRR